MIAAPNTPPIQRLTAVLGTVAIAIALLFVVLLAGVAHARNMRGASILCETGTPTLGGWAEPDTCEGASDGMSFATYKPQRLLDPWTSALGTAVVIGAAGLIGLKSVAYLNRSTVSRSIAPLGMAMVVVLMLSTIAYRGLLVPE